MRWWVRACILSVAAAAMCLAVGIAVTDLLFAGRCTPQLDGKISEYTGKAVVFSFALVWWVAFRKHKRAVKKLSVFLVFTTLICGCGVGARTLEVADVTKSGTIVLNKKTGQGPVHSLSVEVHGKIDGTAEMVLTLEGKPYKTEILTGDIDFRWEGDWYSDQADIRYTPSAVTDGDLRLSYKFND